MDFYTPYDLIKDVGDSFYEQMQSKKWTERKEPIEKLVGIVDKNPKLVPNDSEYHRLIDELSKILAKDANIIVAALAAQLLTRIARGLGRNFEVHASSVIGICLTRLKEVKASVKEPCCECLDACYETTTFANAIEPIKEALNSKAVGSRLQACEFFKRCFLQIDFQTAKKCSSATKEAVELLCKLALGSDPALRDAAMQALAAFMRAIGKQIAAPLLETVAQDKLKMNKVEEYYENFIVEFPPQQAPPKPAAQQKAAPEAAKKTASSTASQPVAQPVEDDEDDFLTPYDLVPHLTDAFYEGLQSKKWSERKEPLENLSQVVEKNPKLKPNDSEFHRLIDELSKILAKDSNILVTAAAASLLAKIARGLKKNFEVHAPSVIAICFLRLKEVKPTVKEPCTDCLEACYLTTNFAAVVEPIKDALVTKAPGTKLAACEFFKQAMLKMDLQTAKKSSQTTKLVVDQLVKLALGSDPACRDAAMQALAAFMRAVGQQLAVPLLGEVQGDKLKMAKVEEYFNAYVQEYPPVTAAAPPPAQKAPEKKVVRPGQRPNKPRPVEPVEEPPIESRTRTPTPESPIDVQEVYRPEPAFVETPMVRQARSAAAPKMEELGDYLTKSAGVPLESLLKLSYQVPRPNSDHSMKEMLDSAPMEKDNSDPKLVLLDALKALNSTDLVVANGAVVDLFALAQDAIDAKLLAPKTEGIIDPIGFRLTECAELLTSDPSPTQQQDVVNFLKNASNFLLRLLPQKDVAKNINPDLFNKLFRPLFELWSLDNVKSEGKSSIKHVAIQLAENVSPNVVFVWLAQAMLPLLREVGEVEKETGEHDYKKTKPGAEFHLLLQTANKVVEVVREDPQRPLNHLEIHRAFAPLTELALNKSIFSAQSLIRNGVVGVVQRFIQPCVEKAVPAAVRLSSEHPTYSSYAIKCVNAFFNRTIEQQAAKNPEYLTKVLWTSLEKFRDGSKYQEALDTLYLVYKLMKSDESCKKAYQAQWDKCMKHSIFDEVAMDIIQKYDEVLKQNGDFDIHAYVFDKYVDDETKELYQRISNLCRRLRNSPSIFGGQVPSSSGQTGSNGQSVKSNFLKDMKRYSLPLNQSVVEENNENTLQLFKGQKTPQRTDENEFTQDLFKTISKKRPACVQPTVQLEKRTLDFVTRPSIPE
ncbi:unnamed protein product [Bursaphelenchus xylophilus]|uniref:(pine wood nematode) hypothetical protein n=1 Tax=Bursaphelenchus xylophilus TaxID=6326 RepID=A0A1I7RI99_BURXY|nr:unnamed protein product [Bursaphelenchus xylophilus]CAG9115058.1 unnamed protein product [Bursaphelenchus xylophilus]